MQELRLTGVDGEHLLLSGEQGTSYRLPIDDALRTASMRTTGPTSSAPSAQETPRPRPARTPAHLTPRDIQARIRCGSTAEQVAAESGLDLAHVLRYEGPVRAERDYVAYLAQRVEVATPLPSHDGYRSAFGDAPALLGDMVAFRAQSYGVDEASLEWDSWRRADGSWHVEASFELPEESTVDLGEQPPAQWTYNPTRKTVTNGNRWAQVLSELEPLDGTLPSRRLSAVADRVFDFEADTDEDVPEPQPADQDSLLDVLRSRRGQRLGVDEEGDDALAELLTRGGIPAAHPRNDDDPTGEMQDSGQATGHDVLIPGLARAPRASEREQGGADRAEEQVDEPGSHHEDGTPRLFDGVSTDTREISIFAQPTRRPQPSAASRGGGREGSGTDGTEPGSERRVKPKRSSVPSWDDIVFGRRSD